MVVESVDGFGVCTFLLLERLRKKRTINRLVNESLALADRREQMELKQQLATRQFGSK
jgi:hypothetical protein